MIELIGGIVGVIIFYAVFIAVTTGIRRLIAYIFRSVTRPIKKAITGIDDYRGPGEIKLVDGATDDSEIEITRVMFRGIIGNDRPLNARVSISLLDSTNGDQHLKPILSVIDQLQEEDTVAFRLDTQIGQLDEGTYFRDWVDIGRIPLDYLIPPRSGNRNIAVLVRFYDGRNPIKIAAGFLANGNPISFETTFNQLFTEPGYEQQSENSQEAQNLCLKLAVGVAVSDGCVFRR